MLTCQKQPICTGKKCAGRKNPDKELENKIQEIRHQHKDYGYRRMTGELKNQGFCVNKKKVQRIMQNLKLQATFFTRRSRKDSSHKGTVETIALNRIALNLKIFLRMRQREVKFTFPIRTAPSNGLRTNVIMACCVNIYQKEYPITRYSEEEIPHFADEINARPRRILGYWTADEVFDEFLDKVCAIKGCA